MLKRVDSRLEVTLEVLVDVGGEGRLEVASSECGILTLPAMMGRDDSKE